MKEVLRGRRRAHGARTRRSAPATRTRALAFLEELAGLYVVKTDGLAAGKGVVVTESIADGARRGAVPTSRARRSATPGARS